MTKRSNVIAFPMHRTRRPVHEFYYAPNFFGWYLICFATTVALGVWWVKH